MVTIKRPSKVERVIPFEGEDDFIVSDNKIDHIQKGDHMFVNVAGTDPQTVVPTTGADTISGGTTGQTTGGGVANTPPIIAPPSTPAPIYPKWDMFDCSTLLAAKDSLIAQGAPADPTLAAEYNAQVQMATNLYNSKCGSNAPQTNSTEANPVFPDYTTMDCAGLQAEINRINGLLNGGTLSPAALSAYSSQINAVTAFYAVKPECHTTVNPPVVTNNPTTTTNTGGTVISSTTTLLPAFGGGGGFGGQLSEDASEVVEEVKKNYSWLWLIALGVGIYFATKKKKQ